MKPAACGRPAPLWQTVRNFDQFTATVCGAQRLAGMVVEYDCGLATIATRYRA